MNSFLFGQTASGLPIVAFEFGLPMCAEVLIIGGVHGDEIEGVWTAYGLLNRFLQDFSYKLHVTLVPAFNLDGVLAKTRANSRGVDLNRNLPSCDWTSDVANPRYAPGPQANSEPENQALTRWLEMKKPRLILSLHSWQPMLNINGDCELEAAEISRLTGYKIEKSIGYATPGCLGTFAGLERNSPTLTYEIERGLNQAACIDVHVPAVLSALKISAQRFSDGVK